MQTFNPILLAQALLVPILAPLLIGYMRKIKAGFQNREGAPIVQPYRELWKLFHKDEVISNDSSWISRVAPYVVFVTAFVVALGLPLIVRGSALPAVADMLTVIYLLTLGVFFLALNGLDVGGAFGGLGASREMTLTTCAEGGFLLSLLLLSFASGTTNITEMVAQTRHLPLIALAPLLLAAIAFFVVLLSENARVPFDNPATHLELTMIHEAMTIESSGKSLALLEWGSWMKLFIFLTILVNVFFPWSIAPVGASFAPLIIALAVFVIKLALGAFLIALIESSMAKMRYLRLPDLLFGALVLDLIAIVIILH